MKPIGSTLLGFVWLVLAAGLAGEGASPAVPTPPLGTAEPDQALAPPASPRRQKPHRQRRDDVRRNQEPIVLFTIR